MTLKNTDMLEASYIYNSHTYKDRFSEANSMPNID